jgi:hypothetical protein
MSWDVILMHVPPDIESAEDLPEGFTSILGPRTAVLSILTSLDLGIDLTDPTWGDLDGDGFSIEFNIGKGDPVETIMLHVRGGGGAIAVIQRICEGTSWRALDSTTDTFINFAENPAAGLEQWRVFKDRVVASLAVKGEQVITDEKGVRLDGIRADAISRKSKSKRKWQFWK